MNFGLPTSVEINGRDEPIRYQYTAILDAFSAMNDPDLDSEEKAYACMYIFYENFEDFSNEDFEPAFKAFFDFVNNGEEEDEHKPNIKMVDFEQDYKLMIPAINRIAGKEIRNEADIHWWTFLGWFMEIGECTYGNILNIRSKRAKGKKLEKWEEEFFKSNRKMILIQAKQSEEDKLIEEKLNKLLNS